MATLGLLVDALRRRGLTVDDAEPLIGGYGGENFLARTSVGRLVLKVRTDVRPLVAARAASRLLSARGLPHAEVLGSPEAVGPGWLLVTRWVPGVALASVDPTSWPERDVARLGRDCALWIRAMHGIRTSRGDWWSAADRRCRRKVEDCRRRGLLADTDVVVVQRRWQELRPHLVTAPVSLIHRDLQPGNLIVDGHAFGGVIDLEQCRPADPVYDVVKLRDYVFPLHPALDAAMTDVLLPPPLDRALQDRLTAVFVLEYLSALVYFHKNERAVDVERQRDLLHQAISSRATL